MGLDRWYGPPHPWYPHSVRSNRMTFEEIRKLTITALFSDDFLFNQLVLKGGNAMNLVLRISPRVSLDLDFSIESDFEDLESISARMETALQARFSTVGFSAFDVKLTPKPSTPSALSWWGGYELNFKLTDENRRSRFGSDRDRLRREAHVVGPNQQKVFTVDFSKCEYTAGKVQAEVDHYTIYVYPPSMIATEKLRAICQQMEDYAPTGRTNYPRARDFYDIFKIVSGTGFCFDAPESRDLLTAIFAAKEVPLSLIAKVPGQREFHRVDWPSVRTTVAEPLEEFDYYFDFVLREIEPLHPFGMK
jgi:hypothetical protein